MNSILNLDGQGREELSSRYIKEYITDIQKYISQMPTTLTDLILQSIPKLSHKTKLIKDMDDISIAKVLLTIGFQRPEILVSKTLPFSWYYFLTFFLFSPVIFI